MNTALVWIKWRPIVLLLSPEIMADYDMVLKFWGPVEADYTKHGGLVLTRSVALMWNCIIIA